MSHSPSPSPEPSPSSPDQTSFPSWSWFKNKYLQLNAFRKKHPVIFTISSLIFLIFAAALYKITLIAAGSLAAVAIAPALKTAIICAIDFLVLAVPSVVNYFFAKNSGLLSEATPTRLVSVSPATRQTVDNPTTTPIPMAPPSSPKTIEQREPSPQAAFPKPSPKSSPVFAIVVGGRASPSSPSSLIDPNLGKGRDNDSHHNDQQSAKHLFSRTSSVVILSNPPAGSRGNKERTHSVDGGSIKERAPLLFLESP